MYAKVSQCFKGENVSQRLKPDLQATAFKERKCIQSCEAVSIGPIGPQADNMKVYPGHQLSKIRVPDACVSSFLGSTRKL